MLSTTPGKMIGACVPDYVIFDLETTGISWKKDDVVEIAGIRVVGGEIQEEYATLVDPGRHIPAAVSMVHGITDDMVRGAPDFEQALGGFLDFAGDLVLAGHNIRSFDLKFLYRDAERYWGQTVGNDFIDTLALARQRLPQLSHHALSDLAAHYGISAAGAHRALNDCRMNQQVLECLRREPEHPAGAGTEVPHCPRCGKPLQKRNGRYGPFWGCGGYPSCRYTRGIN